MPDKPTSPDSPEVHARIREGMELVDKCALLMRRRTSKACAIDDLVSFGREGLLSAARSFDESRAVPVRCWAALRIRGAMIDGLRATGDLPRRVYRELRAIEAGDVVLSASIEEDAAKPIASPAAADERLSVYLAGIATAMAMGIIANEESEREEARTPEEQLHDAELREAVRGAVHRLPEPERTLLDRHYFADLTLEQAARELGLSKSWGSRLHARAVEALIRDMKRNRVER